MEFNPIGFVRSKKIRKMEASRQGATDSGSAAEIELTLKEARQCLEGLEGFSHAWIIFVFHHNQSWKPKVLPPRSEKKVGVFASRSPYRPNSIGMSLVKIKSVIGAKISIDNHDLLDGTPILDIKPYLDYSDAAKNAKMGWVEVAEKNRHRISWSKKAKSSCQFLVENGLSELPTVVEEQLSFNPTDKKRKRVNRKSDYYILSYRTWRIYFTLGENKKIRILNIKSGYTKKELDLAEDPYKDKSLHFQFLESCR